MSIYVWILISITDTSHIGTKSMVTNIATVPTLAECRRVATVIQQDKLYIKGYNKLRCIQVLKA